MAASNDILERTVTCYRAFVAHPELHPFMQPALRQALESLAKQIELVLPPAETPGTQLSPADPAEAAFDATRSALGRLHHCIRGWYAEAEDVLRKLGPLTLGDDPGQDLIRLTLLVAELPKIKAPYFVFVFPPDLLPARLRSIIAAHTAAAAEAEATTQAAMAMHKKQIALRPLAHALWRKQGLDAWVQANVPTYEAQIAFGRERRHKPRKAAGKSPPSDGTAPPPPNSGEPEGAGS